MNPSGAHQAPTSTAEEYSAAATVIPFQRPLPLLRGPVSAGPRNDPSAGPYVLAFRDPASWSASLHSCKSKIAAQCEEGARIGCAVAASRACAPPWWAPLIGQKVNLKEKEDCEVREMESCLANKKYKCAEFAEEKTLRPFMAARVGVCEDRRRRLLSGSLGRKLICWVSLPVENSNFVLLSLQELAESESSVTNYRASEIFVSGEGV